MAWLIKIFGKQGLWGLLIGIVSFIFYRLIKGSVLYSQEKQKAKDLNAQNQQLKNSMAAQAQRERDHEKTMHKINTRQLSADDFSKLLSSYPDER